MSMTENICMAGDFRLHYYVEKSFYNGEVGFQAVIEKGEGCQSTLVIPKFITIDEKNIPVRVIGKKAFLGNPGIVNVTLPKTITSIDNWAFAQCDNLAKIVLMQEQDLPFYRKWQLSFICVFHFKSKAFGCLFFLYEGIFIFQSV